MSTAMTLDAEGRDIDIWLTLHEEIADEALLASYRRLLTDDERAQETKFFFAHDRKRFLITRAMVRSVLSRYAAVAPQDWRFSANRYGRPHIENSGAAIHDLVFNLSHTQGLIALAVARNRVLGIDVESLSAREFSEGIAHHFFSPAEVADFKCLSAERQPQRFFEYWTFKESYIKARGMGLSLPLDRFSFRFPHDGAVTLEIDPTLNDDVADWCFWQYQPTPQHLLALCVQRRDGETFKFTLRTCIPEVMDTLLERPCTRTSLL